MQQEQILMRKQRGYEIAKNSRITKNDKGEWKVPSQNGAGYYQVISNEFGAVPFIPFKSNTTDKSRGSMIWKNMYHYFMLKNDEFMAHYSKKSNVETSVFMIKSKFGDSVRSKNWIAQVNEVLCKVICHNICCVIMEMHTLGIEADFKIISQQELI